MVHFYPIFLHFVNSVNKETFDCYGDEVMGKTKYSDRDMDFEEFDQEIKSFVVQLISLI